MKFFNFKQLKSFTNITKPAFDNIEGYSDIKEIVQRALDSEESYNLLFCGPPASSKTLFLVGIQEIRKDAVYLDGSNTTNRILDILEEKRPKNNLTRRSRENVKKFPESTFKFP